MGDLAVEYGFYGSEWDASDPFTYNEVSYTGVPSTGVRDPVGHAIYWHDPCCIWLLFAINVDGDSIKSRNGALFRNERVVSCHTPKATNKRVPSLSL